MRAGDRALFNAIGQPPADAKLGGAGARLVEHLEVIALASHESHGRGSHEHRAGCLLLARVRRLWDELLAIYRRIYPNNEQTFNDLVKFAVKSSKEAEK